MYRIPPIGYETGKINAVPEKLPFAVAGGVLAVQRVRSQAPQSRKVDSANVVVHNSGSYETLWEQVANEWKKIAPSPDTMPLVRKALRGNLEIQRGRPRGERMS